MTPKPPLRTTVPGFTQRLTSWTLSHSALLLRRLAKGRVESATGVTVGAVWVLIAPLFFLCGVIDWLDGGPDVVVLLVSGFVIQLVGFLILRVSKFPSTLPVARLFTAFVGGALAALIAAAIAHFATGVAPTIDVALVEASATVTGTNATTVEPETLSLGMMLFRSLGQWLAAAAMIVVLVRICLT